MRLFRCAFPSLCPDPALCDRRPSAYPHTHVVRHKTSLRPMCVCIPTPISRTPSGCFSHLKRVQGRHEVFWDALQSVAQLFLQFSLGEITGTLGGVLKVHQTKKIAAAPTKHQQKPRRWWADELLRDYRRVWRRRQIRSPGRR